MTYPGNSSLSDDIKQRVLSTFEHTLDLVDERNQEEALLGCDFILRLDPTFEPARDLQSGLESGDGISVPDLRTMLSEARVVEPPPDAVAVSGAVDPAPEAEPSVAAESLFDDAIQALATEPVEPPPPPTSITEQFASMLSDRDYSSLFELATERAEQVDADSMLRQLVATAHARAEAEPYVKTFVEEARAALDAGDHALASDKLEKARALDPTYPELIELELTVAMASDDLAPPVPPVPVSEPAVSPTESEEQLAELTLGEPAAAPLAAPPTSEGALFETPVESGGDSDSEVRIQELLSDGQAAFDRKDYQGAIDAWSRIFLIDIDHDEANRRIEAARKLRAESEREVEEILHEGLLHAEDGNQVAARDAFEQVLTLSPGHMTATDHLHQLDSEAAAELEQALEAPVEVDSPDKTEIIETLPTSDTADIPLTSSPEPSRLSKPPTRRLSLAKLRGGRSFLYIGGLVMILAAAGAWYLFSHRDSVFPNSSPTASGQRPSPQSPIVEAKKTYAEGKVAGAIAQLRRIAPDSPHHAEAEALIVQWETAAADSETEVEPPAPQALAARDQLIAEARRAASQGRYLVAADLLEQAAGAAPLDEAVATLQLDVAERLDPLRPLIDLFDQGDWEFALPDLWRLHETDPRNPDVRRLIVDAYYNLGVRDLQRGHTSAAMQKFGEALELAPNDRTLERLRVFAETYESRPEDLLYRIFVKYLPFR